MSAACRLRIAWDVELALTSKVLTDGQEPSPRVTAGTQAAGDNVGNPEAEVARWGAIYCLSLTVFGLIASEVLPISLLTPMSAGLGIREAAAGQTVTFTAIGAMAASLLASSLTRGIDRKSVFQIYAVLLIVSNALSALTLNYGMLIAARMLLGVALGGFWSMAASVSTRLVPPRDVPRAIAILYGCISVALTVAPPAATYLCDELGWRAVFAIAAMWGIGGLAVQAWYLPSIPSRTRTSVFAPLGLLRRADFRIAMGCVLLFYGGHFAFLTYSRPFLEKVAGVRVDGLATVLLAYGVANFLGTYLSGRLSRLHLRAVLGAMPMVMAVIASLLVAFGHWTALSMVLVTAWGFAFGTGPVGWASWMTRAAPEQVETAGGLQIACVQLSITLGASLGGMAFDLGGATAVVALSGLALACAAVLVSTSLRFDGSEIRRG